METQILIRTPTDLRDKFKDYAKDSGTTMSELLREFMESRVNGAA